MIMKSRSESEELRLLRCLNSRMELSANDKGYYLNLEKGFEGEKTFDFWLESLSNHYLVINDVFLESNNTLFQIDSLLISDGTVNHFEVKNYDGDFYIKNDIWYSMNGTEIKNPLNQLKRSESLLRRLLRDLSLKYTVNSYLIFVNPHFHLYQAPMNLPAIFPTQLNRFINKMKKISSKINKKDEKLAKQLLSLHMDTSPYMRRPVYSFDQLTKGIACVAFAH